MCVADKIIVNRGVHAAIKVHSAYSGPLKSRPLKIIVHATHIVASLIGSSYMPPHYLHVNDSRCT